MKLERKYNKGTTVRFKWYDNIRDEFENPNNYRVIKGVVEDECFFNSMLIRVVEYNQIGYYNVYRGNILK